MAFEQIPVSEPPVPSPAKSAKCPITGIYSSEFSAVWPWLTVPNQAGLGAKNPMKQPNVSQSV